MELGGQVGGFLVDLDGGDCGESGAEAVAGDG